MTHNIGDVYTLQERETQKWFAFQIIQLGEGRAVYIDLDYWSDRKPTADNLKKMHVLYLNHHLWNNGVNMCWSEYKWFPSKAELVGNIPVLLEGDCKSFAAHWPDGTQQKLTEKWLESVPADAGKAIKRLYKNRIQDLSVCKLRSNEWLQENLNNPLRHWDGSEFIPKSKYNKAVALWKEARHKIFEAAKEPNTFSDSVLSIATDYIEGFNKLDRRSGFIETEEREDIINAFESILDDVDLKIDRESLQKVMDEKKDLVIKMYGILIVGFTG